jgi:hypothetical protein
VFWPMVIQESTLAAWGRGYDESPRLCRTRTGYRITKVGRGSSPISTFFGRRRGRPLVPFELDAHELRALGITITRLPSAYCVNSQGTVSERSPNVAHGLVDEGQRSAEA